MSRPCTTLPHERLHRHQGLRCGYLWGRCQLATTDRVVGSGTAMKTGFQTGLVKVGINAHTGTLPSFVTLNECRAEEEIKGPKRGPERSMVTPSLTLLSCKHLGVDHKLASENNGKVVLHSSGGWGVRGGVLVSPLGKLRCRQDLPPLPVPLLCQSNSIGPCP